MVCRALPALPVFICFFSGWRSHQRFLEDFRQNETIPVTRLYFYLIANNYGYDTF